MTLGDGIAAVTHDSQSTKPMLPEADLARLFLDELWDDFASGKARDRLPTFFSNIVPGFVHAAGDFLHSIPTAVQGWSTLTFSQLGEIPAAVKDQYQALQHAASDYAAAARDDDQKFAAMTGKLSGNLMFQAVLAKAQAQLTEATVARLTGNAEVEAAAMTAMQDEIGMIDKFGAAGEAANLKGLAQKGTKAYDLNGLAGEGENFPLLDAVHENGLQSVKVKPLAENWLKAYRDDFYKLLKNAGYKVTKQQKAAAAKILAGKDKIGPAWPKGLNPNATLEEVMAFIQEHAELVVPDEHAGLLKTYIRDHAGQFPENYGLNPSSATLAADIEALVDRMKPIGVTADAIARWWDTLSKGSSISNPMGLRPPLAWPPVGLSQVGNSGAGNATEAGAAATAGGAAGTGADAAGAGRRTGGPGGAPTPKPVAEPPSAPQIPWPLGHNPKSRDLYVDPTTGRVAWLVEDDVSDRWRRYYGAPDRPAWYWGWVPATGDPAGGMSWVPGWEPNEQARTGKPTTPPPGSEVFPWPLGHAAESRDLFVDPQTGRAAWLPAEERAEGWEPFFDGQGNARFERDWVRSTGPDGQPAWHPGWVPKRN